ncbi:hypothetical protein [Jeotgalibacillus terrae]|uniref:Uncharacterized protein n=1 Tax=Jeotgalibacillus terrae TaxID=587735 RepID=A0ABW5ZLK6_9BACL|nr:hypothetical protein [Jeotgalibacillus terrae]MBM7580829.1 hypothetical protein [Jeotgalibacillus terrae]
MYYNDGKSEEQLQKEIEFIINSFKEVGIIMENKVKTPMDGEYSAVIGQTRKRLTVRLKK